MADEQENERTEDPTQKKLDDALERGDVAKSQEVNTWFVLGGALLALYAFGDSAASGLRTMFRGLLSNAHAISFDSVSLVRLTASLGIETIAAVLVPLVLLMLAAIAGNMIQHRLVWTGQSLKPKFERVSPLAGMKRLFSKQALVNFIKGLLKLVLIGALMVWLLWPERYKVNGLVSADMGAILPITEGLTLKLLSAVAAALALLAAADYLYQYQTWYNRQKMSVRELKEEYKQTEGDPTVKGRIRQLRQARMRKRMMAAVPKASVIITNPTHYAVALQYERGMNAPVCVAKGVDSLALKIRELARAHDIPIVENPPLARALHATVDIDEEIPNEHYQAVAEVIGYIMRLRRRMQ
ncbi:MAG: flagellar biosynthesis protein FlhB [Variibacter sp.]|nr:flagellar biosynthesis protein FlhB [Variibacter sp.]